ncbi:MAG: hypothetical protein NTW07_02085 [candidate division Zixibacteria bacterium]|nr:hypothetical protein [candidate division Zixibacteria bacterium]
MEMRLLRRGRLGVRHHEKVDDLDRLAAHHRFDIKLKRCRLGAISNQVSLYQNYDDSGEDRGRTLQVIAINNFKLWTEFSFEYTADYNFHLTPGLQRDHYVELSLVKPVTSLISLNVQRVISSFEPESINQFGVRLVF